MVELDVMRADRTSENDPPSTGRDAVTTTLATPLTAADRCDRCGAQAYVRVVLGSGGELLFCAHHGRAHDARLRQLDAAITDETDRLQAEATTSSRDV
jgi:hypothetical protein